MYKKLLIVVFVGIALAGCKKNIAPLDDNHLTLEDVNGNAFFAEGILMNAYTRLPTNSYSFSEVATDDAVTTLPQGAEGTKPMISYAIERQLTFVLPRN